MHDRWRAQRMAEDYVNLVGDMMYPKVGFGPYGYDTAKVRSSTQGLWCCVCMSGGWIDG